jgi:hypothetical protein
MDVGNARVVVQAYNPFNACILYIRVHQNIRGPCDAGISYIQERDGRINSFAAKANRS